MKRKITVNVAIAAYNAEKNIEKLVQSIRSQKERNFTLKKIIVNSDYSTDKTVQIARKIKDKRIKVIDSKVRAGYAKVMVDLMKANRADILITLNDDIIINDPLYLEKAITPFLQEKNIGLVSCNMQALSSETFTAKAVQTGNNAFKKLGVSLKNGNNFFTCDGKTLCFSRKFINSINFPRNYKIMGNVDGYFYLKCMKNKYKYRYAKDAILYFKFPSTIGDFIKWQTRSFTSSNYTLRKTFGKLADDECKIPFILFTYYRIEEFFKNPIGSILIKILDYYCLCKANAQKTEFDTKWETVLTTKEL